MKSSGIAVNNYIRDTLSKTYWQPGHAWTAVQQAWDLPNFDAVNYYTPPSGTEQFFIDYPPFNQEDEKVQVNCLDIQWQSDPFVFWNYKNYYTAPIGALHFWKKPTPYYGNPAYDWFISNVMGIKRTRWISVVGIQSGTSGESWAMVPDKHPTGYWYWRKYHELTLKSLGYVYLGWASGVNVGTHSSPAMVALPLGLSNAPTDPPGLNIYPVAANYKVNVRPK